MKTIRIDLIVVTICLLFSSLATATSYVPSTIIEEEQADKSAVGIVCLFHGANPDVVRHLLGQGFSVFHDPAVDTSPVGKVRLTTAIGAHHLEAVKIEGDLKSGDVVQLGDDTYALVVLTNGRCESLQPPHLEPGK